MITRRLLLQSGAALGATLAAPHIARASGKMVRLAHATSEIHPGHVLATSFRDALEDILPGAFNVQIFPNRQLGDDKQNLESAVAGTNELCGTSGVLFPLVTGRPALDAYQLRIQTIAGGMVPSQIFLMLPYIFSIAALALVARRADYPRALMKPYFKGQR